MNENEIITEPQTDESVLSEDITPLLVHRQPLAELSEYFGRDARRYDNGFEIY